jgi:hypothetical protein
MHEGAPLSLPLDHPVSQVVDDTQTNRRHQLAPVQFYHPLIKASYAPSDLSSVYTTE